LSFLISSQEKGSTESDGFKTSVQEDHHLQLESNKKIQRYMDPNNKDNISTLIGFREGGGLMICIGK